MFCGNPDEALGRFADPPGCVFDPPQGMKGIGQRNTRCSLHNQAGPAGQPVVAVHDVEGLALHAFDHAIGERLHRGGQFVHGKLRPGTRCHVHDPVVRKHRDIGRLRRVRCPRENIDLHSALHQSAGQFVDIDIHPAGVAGPGLDERRGVQREEGDATDHVEPSNLKRCRAVAPSRNL